MRMRKNSDSTWETVGGPRGGDAPGSPGAGVKATAGRLTADALLAACGAAPGSRRWRVATAESFAGEAGADRMIQRGPAVDVLAQVAVATANALRMRHLPCPPVPTGMALGAKFDAAAAASAAHGVGRGDRLDVDGFEQLCASVAREVAASSLSMFVHRHRYPLAAIGGILAVSTTKKFIRCTPAVGPLLGFVMGLLPTVLLGPPVGLAALYASEGAQTRTLRCRAVAAHGCRRRRPHHRLAADDPLPCAARERPAPARAESIARTQCGS